MKKSAPFLLVLIILSSCSIQKQIAKQANEIILANPDFAPANVGISLYDPATRKYLYDFQGSKFFVPASNTKLFTCYAAMKNLGDSLVGLRYSEVGTGDRRQVSIEPTADPTFLLPEFRNQPVFDFLKREKNIYYYEDQQRKQFSPYGRGWPWDDYSADYAPERNEFPIHGNYVTFTAVKDTLRVAPSFFGKKEFLASDATRKSLSELFRGTNFRVTRIEDENKFLVRGDASKFTTTAIPFKTVLKDNQTRPLAVKILEDTLGVEFNHANHSDGRFHLPRIIYSQPTDSMLKIMMHRSDNFFAEQTLLMVSNEKLGFMSDRKLIDTLLKTDFAGLPQKPQWVDGSGLSRYNLISPQDFVWVLTQMKNEFKWERIKEILPTGGEGTLSSYYKNYAGRIYAKTGSLSNHLALSGYITTKKGRQLVFSVLVNAHNTAAANIRKAVEKFLVGVMDKY